MADSAAIDVANADLAIAQKAVTLGTLTSPFAGTVAAVSLSAGDEVSASSTTAVITVIGDDGYVVSGTVTLADVQGLEVGQTASIEVPSADATLDGTVSSIGVLNVSTDSSTPSYAVTLAVASTDTTLLNGASAQAVVPVSSTDDVLTVPTSAVHRTATAVTVDVLKDGKSVATTVEVGAEGSEQTEITSGLTEGDTVILADLDAAIDSGDTETDSSLTGLSDDSSTTQQQGGPPSGFTGGPPSN